MTRIIMYIMYQQKEVQAQARTLNYLNMVKFGTNDQTRNKSFYNHLKPISAVPLT